MPSSLRMSASTETRASSLSSSGTSPIILFSISRSDSLRLLAPISSRHLCPIADMRSRLCLARSFTSPKSASAPASRSRRRITSSALCPALSNPASMRSLMLLRSLRGLNSASAPILSSRRRITRSPASPNRSSLSSLRSLRSSRRSCLLSRFLPLERGFLPSNSAISSLWRASISLRSILN